MTATTYSNTRTKQYHSQRHHGTHIAIEKFAKNLQKNCTKKPSNLPYCGKLWLISVTALKRQISATRCVTEICTSFCRDDKSIRLDLLILY